MNKSGRYIAQNMFVSNNTRNTNLNNNDLIVGNSGCGKTGSYVTPAILTADHSIVIADTKNQLFRKYKNYLKNKGFKVQCLDFVHPERSMSYNPLDFIQKKRLSYKVHGKTVKYTKFNEQDYHKIARILIPNNNFNQDPFWPESARLVLSSLIAYVCEALEEDSINLGEVGFAFQLMSKQLSKSSDHEKGNIKMFKELEILNPDSYAVKSFQLYLNVLGAEKCWGSISMFLADALCLFDNSENKQMLCRKSEVNLSKLGKEKTALFLNLSDTDRSMDPIINLFYNQLFQVLCNVADETEEGKLPVPVRIILDDFASNIVIEDFDKIISTIRSRDIYASIILQSISQLSSIYNTSQAKTIINNCDHAILMGTSDTESAEYFSKKTGKLPETILNMPLDKCWVFERGKEARLMGKIKPYSFDVLMAEGKSIDKEGMFNDELQ